MLDTKKIEISPGEKSLRMIRWEIALTSAQLVAPIAYLMFHNSGLSVAEFGAASALAMIAQLVINTPAGVLGDWFSQKWLNVIGDMVACIGFIWFALSSTLPMFLAAYTVIGIGNAVSMGANQSLMARHSEITATSPNANTGLAFPSQYARSKQLTFALMAAGSIIMPLLAVWPGVRTTIIIGGLAYLIGAILALRVSDLKVEHTRRSSLLKHAWAGTKYIVQHKAMRPWFAAYVIAALLWQPAMAVLFTPAILEAGVPQGALSICWVITIATAYIASRRAEKYLRSLKFSSKTTRQSIGFLIATLPALIAATILSISINPWTIGAYVGFGFAFGWSQALMMTYIRPYMDPRHTNMLISSIMTITLAGSAGMIALYGQLAIMSVSNAMLWTVAPFSIIVFIVWRWCHHSTVE